jgi:CubicO group peptidase (beta-lactamase class C family)
MSTKEYFPPPEPHWAPVKPQSAGFDAPLLKEAVNFAMENEFDWPRSLTERPLTEQMKEPPPFNEIIGPMKDRGGPNGLIVRGGKIVIEWGDTRRVDMTFSASKSYISTCAGLAFDRSLISDIHAPVRDLVDDGGFEPPHNHKITWHHLLQQTSEWEGTLWGKPDTIDRNRIVGPGGYLSPKGTNRKLKEPGTHFEYNDVRVNRASLALMRVWRRPLPEVLKEFVMDPIGASDSWEWHGYRNSYVVIDGRKIQSVSGGGHWGGGLFVSSRDHARFGYLMLRGGQWNNRTLLSQKWIELMTTPCEQNPEYGYMFWLNHRRKLIPSAPASCFSARGAGSNFVLIDPDHDIVAVIRWIKADKINFFYEKLLAALR